MPSSSAHPRVVVSPLFTRLRTPIHTHTLAHTFEVTLPPWSNLPKHARMHATRGFVSCMHTRHAAESGDRGHPPKLCSLSTCSVHLPRLFPISLSCFQISGFVGVFLEFGVSSPLPPPLCLGTVPWYKDELAVAWQLRSSIIKVRYNQCSALLGSAEMSKTVVEYHGKPSILRLGKRNVRIRLTSREQF